MCECACAFSEEVHTFKPNHKYIHEYSTSINTPPHKNLPQKVPSGAAVHSEFQTQPQNPKTTVRAGVQGGGKARRKGEGGEGGERGRGRGGGEGGGGRGGGGGNTQHS